MRIPRLFVPLPPLALFATAVACGSVPDDPGARIFPPGGIIRGTVLYQGPRPCSRNGHIVGNAVLLVFDRRNPPPPNGLANTAVNFADVTGDALFANEPRYTGPDTYCPAASGFTETVTVSAPFVIGAVSGGSYMIQAFFDYTGDFLPTFKVRNLPEQGDIGGGYVDTADALKPINANINYQPIFLPIDIGTPEQVPPGSPAGTIPVYDLPSTGFVADNVTVSIGSPLALTRPYFYPQGEVVTANLNDPSVPLTVTPGDSSDKPLNTGKANANPAAPATVDDPTLADYPYVAPILSFPQDLAVHAPPISPTPQNANYFESAFPHLSLKWYGSLKTEAPLAATPPFNMQIAPFATTPAGGGFAVWEDARFDAKSQMYVAQQIPEGQGVPYLWPLLVLNKLVDDPSTGDPNDSIDPASLTAQGDPNNPVVILQGITLAGNPTPGQPDSLFLTAAPLLGLGAPYFDPSGNPVVTKQDHLTVLLRPSVICFDQFFNPQVSDKRGVLVAPHPVEPTADVNCPGSSCSPGTTPGNVVPPDLLTNNENDRVQVSSLVRPAPGGKPSIEGCLPTGRYAINLVYPDGQAWTVPNEAGACSGEEGSTDYQGLTCTGALQQRPVLLSQGKRAVVEITKAKDPTYCQNFPVPPQCLPAGQ
jgi:hypothetical protein